MSDYKKLLEISLNNKDIKKNAIERRKANIDAFASINRIDLQNSSIEKRMLLYTTKRGEKIYIQYPGKESAITLLEDSRRPWDFRPKLIDKDGNIMADLRFKDIWDDIVELRNVDIHSLALLGAVFYRLSMMIDTTLVEEECEVEKKNLLFDTIEEKTVEKLTWYKINLDDKLIEYLNEAIGDIRGFSFEAYLYYNDLLCQNEDCKYYYRDTLIKKIDWDTNVGRRNTYWTHISIIGLLKGQIRLTNIMDKFQRTQVAPIAQRDIPMVTDNIIKKE